MKDQAIQYLALDVHQATVVATVRDQTGAVRMRATVPTEARAIIGLVKGLGPRVPMNTPVISRPARSITAAWSAGKTHGCS